MLDFDVEYCHRSSCSEISDHMLLAYFVSMNESWTGTNQASVLLRTTDLVGFVS